MPHILLQITLMMVDW